MIIRAILTMLAFAIVYSIKTTWLTIKNLILHIYRHPFQALLNLLLLVILLFITDTASKLEDNIIRSQISDRTVNNIIAASSFTRRYNAENIENTASRELLDVGAPNWSQKSGVRAVLFYARKAQLSIEHQAALLAIAEVESGFNPMARALTTSACGLFQFVEATGKRYRLERQECMDPWHNAQAGVEHYMDNYEKRIKNAGLPEAGRERAFRLFELSYHLHHDGASSQVASETAKTTVLRGTPFLLKVYTVLDNESQSKEQLTGVVEQLIINLKSWLKGTVFARLMG